MIVGEALGPYRIVEKLGEGGMGEVYRARDARLGRDVAIKALHDSSLMDADRVARFEREARTLGALNHPHIAAIYGLERAQSSAAAGSGATQYLILELVEGGTLADRLKNGPLPVRDALLVARQVADALEAAHDKQIVHRDLKPANVALTPRGDVKVLDFGLAKGPAIDSALEATVAATQAGLILGTAAYMSPEQARGAPLDKRSDIWSFGCVLYEALTGRYAFHGRTISDTIVAVLEHDPDWAALPANTPSRVTWLLRRCLDKDPKNRLHDIADARIELDEALARPTDSAALRTGEAHVAARAARSAAGHARAAWTIAAVCLAAALAAVAYATRTTDRAAVAGEQSIRASIELSGNLRLWAGEDPSARFAVSPDGRRLAFVAADLGVGRPMLWIRPMNGLLAQPIAGTEDASYPFWSPDSRFVGFIARPAGNPLTPSLRGTLQIVDLQGGQPRTLANVGFPASPSWSGDVILFTPQGTSPLYRVSTAGGTPSPATTLDAASGDVQHSYPAFLPDGRHFLYSTVGTRAGGATDPRAVYVASLDPKEPAKLVLQGAAQARFANGYLIFLRGGTLMAQPFDAGRLELHGDAAPLAERIQVAGVAGGGLAGAFSVSATGVLAYQTDSVVQSQLTWFDRGGRQLATLGDLGDYAEVVLSPDDSRAAVSALDRSARSRDLWIFDVARDLHERITSDPADEIAPVWSPDGSQIIFTSLRNGSIALYQKKSAGTDTERVVPVPGLDVGKFAASWSPDGRFLAFVAGGRIIARSDLWILPLGGDRKAFPFLDTPDVESHPRFSPDGRWIAYTSAQSGIFEVYVAPFPGPGDRQRVSTAGGGWPLWRRDGSEIFYLAPDKKMMSAAVTRQGSTIQVGAVRPLFPVRLRPSVRLDAYPYAVTADGQRFLLNHFVEDTSSAAITLLVNWPAELKR